MYCDRSNAHLLGDTPISFSCAREDAGGDRLQVGTGGLSARTSPSATLLRASVRLGGFV